MRIAYAALSLALAASGNEIQLTPAGVFRARDGRPGNLPGWKIDSAIASRVIARAAARQTPFVTDYEHQTLAADKNGQPAPAAGWFKKLEWRDGQGLFATDVEWTAKAKAYIDAGEYKFISPVFSFDRKTGEVLQLEMAALTNNPGLDGMSAVSALATEFFNRPGSGQSQEDRPMKAIAILLGLGEDASEADVSAAITALKTKTGEQDTQITALKAETVSLKAQAPDPAKYVPIETVTQLQTEVATLTARINDGELEGVIKSALDEGKLLPAMEEWARDLGKKDLAALKTYVEKNPAIAALKGTQTGGREPGTADGAVDVNDPESISRAALKYQTEQAATGNVLSTAQAVAHVTKGA